MSSRTSGKSSTATTSNASAGCPDLPVIGVDDEALQPAGILAKGPLLLAGPPGSGRTVALVTLAYALRRSNPGVELIYVGSRRSMAAALKLWDRSVVGADNVQEAIDELVDYSTGTPGKLAIFIEGLTDFTDTGAESGIERLVTASADVTSGTTSMYRRLSIQWEETRNKGEPHACYPNLRIRPLL